MLVAKTLEKLAEPTIKVTLTKKPPAQAVNTVRPFVPPTDQTGTNQAHVQQKRVPSTLPAIQPHQPD